MPKPKLEGVVVWSTDGGGGDGIVIGPAADCIESRAAITVVTENGADLSHSIVANMEGNGIVVHDQDAVTTINDTLSIGNAGHGFQLNRHERRKKAKLERR